MRVLFVAHSFPRFAGDVAGSFLHRLARALQAAGVEVGVVAPGGPGLRADEEVGGVRVHRFRYAPRRLETLAYTGTMAEAVRGSWGARAAFAGLLGAGALQTARAARRWHADVVHAHWWFPGGASAAAPGVLGGRPLVLTLHGSDVRLGRRVAPARAAYARVARRATQVTAVSRWLCKEATAMAPDVPCSVARMPVAAELFHPPDHTAPPRDGVLFVGRLTAQKGVDVLLHALAGAIRDARLTVVGAGPAEGELRALADRLGVAERVRWVATQPQRALAQYFRAARVLAVPSTEEGLGLVAVEAALCGTPTVGFASGGLPDVVADGVGGRLVPAGDRDAFAAALSEVLLDPAVAERYGQLAASRAAEFTPAACAARFRNVYEAALARSGRSARG